MLQPDLYMSNVKCCNRKFMQLGIDYIVNYSRHSPAFRTASDRKLGRAWEQVAHLSFKILLFLLKLVTEESRR